MKKAASISLLLLILPLSVHAQEKPVTLDQAINKAVQQLFEGLPDGSKVAVYSFTVPKNVEESLSERLIAEINELFTNARRNTKPRFIIVERQEIKKAVQQEVDFQLSGEVSNDDAVRLGQNIAANFVISGTVESTANSYRLRIKAVSVQEGVITSIGSADIKRNDPDIKLLFKNSKKQKTAGDTTQLWTVGASAGTSFATPFVITTIHGTFAPFKNSFFEIGCDFGWVSDTETADYYSIYPFVHYAFFQPIDKNVGWYIGGGGGWMYASYTVDGEHFPVDIWALHLTTGLNIFNNFDVSYTLRTNIKSVNHKASFGFVYRFK